jgi:hypothetical protein
MWRSRPLFVRTSPAARIPARWGGNRALRLCLRLQHPHPEPAVYQVVTVEFKVNFLAPASGRVVVARGRVVRAREVHHPLYRERRS